jgi:hypothetical protein
LTTYDAESIVPPVISAGGPETTCGPVALTLPRRIALSVIEPLGLEESGAVVGPVETP